MGVLNETTRRIDRTSRGRLCRPRRGSILITAMWIIVIVSALALVFAQSMRVELTAAGNRMSIQQAEIIEQAAEQYVLSVIENSNGDSFTITSAPGEAMRIFNGFLPDGPEARPGYFWLLRPADSSDIYTPTFGIMDEAAKVSLNAASRAELIKLPGMTEDLADAIMDWRDTDKKVTGQGAESDYYLSLPEPYIAKDGPFETVEELWLVRGITPEVMYGSDLDHDGTLNEAEQMNGGVSDIYNSANGAGRGIFPFITVFSVDFGSNTTTTTTSTGGRTTTTGGTVTGSATGSATATAAKKGTPGKVNVNTAPREVLRTLPGLNDTDADAMIAKRPVPTLQSNTGTTGSTGSTGSSGTGTTDNSSTAWVRQALSAQKAAGIANRITGKSYQFSADILAISGDGRSFKRVRIVVDNHQTPARIVYRKDISDLGWPLPEEIRDLIRDAQALPSMSSQSGTFGMR